MKKQFLAAAVMVLLPLTASASVIGTGTLDIAPSNYSGGRPSIAYDYDVSSYNISDKKIVLAKDNSSEAGYETFCISSDTLTSYNNTYSFYAASDIWSSTTTHDGLNVANFVTWVANWAATDLKVTASLQESDKEKAQQAIWQFLGVEYIFDSQYQDLKRSFLSATAATQASYTSEWLVALNGTLGGSCHDGGNQDFLVHASPVPVPSTLLLLGSGLTGLVAAGRRRKQR